MEGERPVFEYAEVVTVVSWVPFRYMRYPLTATLSVEAVQERLIWVEEIEVVVREVGVEGGVVSATGVVMFETVTVIVAEVV